MNYKFGYRALYGYGTKLFIVTKRGAVLIRESLFEYNDNTRKLEEISTKTRIISEAGSDNRAVYTNRGRVFVIKTDGTLCELVDSVYNGLYTTHVVIGIENCVKVCISLKNVIALTSDGTVYAWGDNTYGQFGDGNFISRQIPERVRGLAGIIDIAGGWDHYLALDGDGNVYSWGRNHVGQIGDGTHTRYFIDFDKFRKEYEENDYGDYDEETVRYSSSDIDFDILLENNDRNTVYRVEGLAPVAQIGAGDCWSAVLQRDGTVLKWGGWKIFMVGKNPYNTEPKPVKGMPENIKAITVSETFAFALDDAGEFWSWGCVEHKNGIADGIRSLNDLRYMDDFPEAVKVIPNEFAVVVTKDEEVFLGQIGGKYFNETFERIFSRAEVRKHKLAL